jgi:Helix-turn-helix domain
MKDNITKPPIDLAQFREELLQDVQHLINNSSKEWLRTDEAQEYLTCNRMTLLNLRNQHKLNWFKLGGMIFYNRKDLDKTITNNQQ